MIKTSNIDILKNLRREHLDPNNYAISLLNAARRQGMVDQAALDSFQARIMVILAELILKYTKGESSSLKTETTQRLLISVFYTIDAGLNDIDDPQEALDLLLSADIKEIYQKGLDLLTATLSACQHLYQKIDKSKLALQNEAYESTIDELPDFFNSYDILYNAQDTMANIDYPLLFDDMSIQGIFYVKQYMEKLLLENQFCQLYAPAEINQLLFNYGRVYRINYRESLINIFEIVVGNAIYSILSGNDGTQLRINEEQFERLQQNLISFDPSLVPQLLDETIVKLLHDLQIDQPESRFYIQKYKSLLLPRLINALENNCLQNIIIVDREIHQQFELVFDEGNSLDDEHFRQVVDDIMDCAKAEEKTAIILSEIHSLGDFIDILEAECLFAEEYHDLFNHLGDVELSILARVAFIEEIRTNLMDFSLNDIEEDEITVEWQIELWHYLQSLSSQGIKSIETYIKISLQL